MATPKLTAKEARLLARQEKAKEQQHQENGDNFGTLPLIQSASRPRKQYADISTLSTDFNTKLVLLRVRVQAIRATSSMCFLVFRQGMYTVQGIVPKKTSRELFNFAQKIPKESLVEIEGTITISESRVQSVTQQTIEVLISKLFIISKATSPLPLQLEENASLETRLNNRVLDLRTEVNHAIFRIQAGVGRLFREYLENNGFLEIHTPKLIAAASEGGANVFPVTYFDRMAYLAQSPQLAKQMMICSDYPRVYEIGPVFRAENTNTHRHMTEFIGLDLEMQIQEHYHEVLEMMDGLFLHIFDGIRTKYSRELDIINAVYPFTPIKYSRPTHVITFTEGTKMLNEAGTKIGPLEDLGTAEEKQLGALVKEKYDVDFYILDKFPTAVRPFYTMPDPTDSNYTNSYDLFIRGEEIVSGSQRIHDAGMLEESAKSRGVTLSQIQPYLDAFKYGAPPHGGCGIGLERVVLFYLGLGDIRRACLFPRDPTRLSP